MAELSPAEIAVEKSLEAMTQTLRDLTGNLAELRGDVDGKLDAIREDVGGLKQTLGEIAVENRHWVAREDFVRLEGELKASAIEEARAEVKAETDAREKAVKAEAVAREKADDKLAGRHWYLLGLIIATAVALAVEYLKKGGGP